MRTGLHKQDKTTEIYFDEASPTVEIRTYNTDLKKRFTAFSVKYPDLCKLTDEDEETGCKSFVIAKRRFSVRLTAPYSEERRRKASVRRKIIEHFHELYQSLWIPSRFRDIINPRCE